MANRRDGFILRTKIKTANVIEATIKLISKRPIEDITIGEIAKKARVSQVTIYNHFENKNAVMIEAIKKLITDNVDQIHQILMSQLPFKERLYAYIDGVFLQSIERPRLDNIKNYILAGHVPELLDFINEVFAKTKSDIDRLYQDGRSAEFIREEISQLQFVRMLEMYTQISPHYIKHKSERHIIIESLIRGFR